MVGKWKTYNLTEWSFMNFCSNIKKISKVSGLKLLPIGIFFTYVAGMVLLDGNP
jgi:hypothetical protein